VSVVQIWGSIASRLRRHPRDARVRFARAPTAPIEPLDFPEDTAPASEILRKLDWFSTDLYAFGLNEARQI